MEKLWIDGEEGKLAIESVQDHPESLQVFTQHGKKKIYEMERRVLGISIKDPAKDRELLVERAQLEGARLMLNSFIELLSKGQDKKGKNK